MKGGGASVSEHTLPPAFRKGRILNSGMYLLMMNSVVVGLQWGDEGKGKVVDAIAGSYDVVVRFNGGPNAGHTVIFDGQRYALHHIPSGIFRRKVCLIAAGTIIDPDILLAEVDDLESHGIDTRSLKICGRCHLILPIHKIQDEIEEGLRGRSAVGTTKRGIGPCYMDRDARIGIRFSDLYDEETLRDRVQTLYRFKGVYFRDNPSAGVPSSEDVCTRLKISSDRLLRYMVDGVSYLNTLIRRGKNTLFEGAQGTLLDINYGSYPYVTSSSCIAGYASAGSGVPMEYITDVIGVTKAYVTRVGSGPLPTEMEAEVAREIQERGREFGTTTGRVRRVGWLDLVVLRSAVMMNGVKTIALMKVDVLAGLDEVRVCTHYTVEGKKLKHLPLGFRGIQPVYRRFPGWGEIKSNRFDNLPPNLKRYISFIEKETGARIALISYGPDRENTIVRKGVHRMIRNDSRC